MKFVRLLGCLCIAFACVSAAWVQAASPVFNGLSPRGGQRGTEIDVTLSGGQLNDAQEVLFYEPGISVTSLKAEANNVKVKFKIAADAPLGSHRMRIRTATGISELRPFFVSALKELTEKEPNSDFASPQAVPMNVVVNGVADNEDVDYFVVEAKKGDRITAEVEGIRLGITLFDAYVSIMNSARFELASCDDSPLVWPDAIASVIAPADGKYIVQVRESSYAGNGACLYRVHIGNFPRPQALLPAGGKLGEKLAVKFLGDVAGDRDEQVSLPAAFENGFGLFGRDDKGIAPSRNLFRLTDLGNVTEVEPNSNHMNATVFTAPMALNGVISVERDEDNYRFKAKRGETYDIRVHARSIRSPLDPVLTIHVAKGGGIAGNDDSNGPDSYVRLTVPNDGEYIIHVSDHLGKGGPNYVYRVELTRVEPRLTLSTAEFTQYIQPVMAVPRGNRCGVLLNIGRYDFGGPLEIRAENLPAGIRMEAPPVAANLAIVPVIFHADGSAPLAGKLSDIIGSLVDPKQPQLRVSGKLEQPMVLVRGQNNIPFYNENTDKLPVAVTEECPFDISVVEPKVPIVRGGQMDLKVVAKRKSGFNAAIKIDMLWLPPGLNASGSISIPEKQNEASIPMNLSGNAELNTWKIAVRGQAQVGNGQILVCTPFVNLRTADMYLNLTFDASAVEQGKETEIIAHMEKRYDFPGEAKVTLYGLPNKAVTTPQSITKETKDIVFKVKTDKTTPAGNHNNLFCSIIVTENSEPVIHNIGTGRLRVDVPLPPKKNSAPPPPPKPAVAKAPPKPAPVAAAPPRRLTRLEQLRLDQAEQEKTRQAKP